jgi:alpha,alpha-trehalose phosphorylase
MRSLNTDPVDRDRFPIREWGIAETTYDLEGLGARETIFTVGNGYLGLRGNHEEGDSDAYAHGTFINGFYETWQIRHAEEAFGFAKAGQTIVNVPDAKVISISVNGETLVLNKSRLESYQRSLDFREGILHRDLVWTTKSGLRVALQSTRMVSFTRRNLAVMTFDVTVLDGDAEVIISSQVQNRQGDASRPASGFDPRRAAYLEDRVLQCHLQSEDQTRMTFGYRVAQSKLGLALSVDHELFTANPHSVKSRINANQSRRTYRIQAKSGEPIRLVKWVAYVDGPANADVTNLAELAQLTLDDAMSVGLRLLVSEQRDWLDNYWSNADVELLNGPPGLQQAVRWCLFELAQATGRADGRGIGAKGVTGGGYEGHYFWDTEVYLVPFLAHTNPALARRALRFRIGILDAARARAHALSQRGALFPWRTINGQEASAYYAAGTAQYHIDADIAYAMCKYADVCADENFLLTEALPVLVETARLWVDLGFFRGPERSFHIHSVTGPDEYSAVVNNNLYTNLMARMNLMRAAQAVLTLAEVDPGKYADLAAELGVTECEVTSWQEAATAMYIPYHEWFGVHPQDEDFLKREVWDLAGTPIEKLPLLLHYHPLVIYRFQVLKQADAILALFLAGESFTPEEKRADYEYYEPITTGDSTLSAVVQAIIAAEVGYQDRALESFMEGAFVDLADLHHNTGEGVHIASAGGVWNALVYGFAGLRDHNGDITFDPRLPEGWEALRFAFKLRGSRVRAELTANQLILTLEVGPGGKVSVRGQEIEVTGHEPVRIPLFGQGLRLPTLTGHVPLIHGRPANADEVTIGLPTDPVE